MLPAVDNVPLKEKMYELAEPDNNCESLNYAETRELHNLLNGMETFGSGEQDMEKVKKSPKIRSKIGKNPVDGKERER